MILEIDGVKIGTGNPPYVIAEISANHNGQLKNALKLIDMASRCGANAVKLQSYTPDTITLDCDHEDFIIRGGLWDGRRLYDLYKEAFLPWEWHKPLFEHASEVGISIFSSVFDNSAVDFLEDLNTPAYKIASFEAIDIPLIKYAASTGKPMIISTGLADQEEISEAIDAARSAGCCNLAILHCVSGYPAPISDYNLRTIVDMKERFGIVTGLSDHTISNTTALAGVALGASIVEKHITLDQQGGGPDDSFSLESDDLERLCCEAKTAWQALGSVDYGLKSSEIGNVKFRRSLYFVKALKAGMKITQGDIRSVRPGYGAAPKHYDSIIGKVVKHSVGENTPVELSNLI
jgi:N-acetylneuraminate synthase